MNEEFVRRMWNAAQQSRIRAVEMSYMRGACGVSRLDAVCNEDKFGRFGLSEAAVGVLRGAVVCQGGIERVMRTHMGGLA